MTTPHDKRMAPVLAAVSELEVALTARVGPQPTGLDGPRPAWRVYAAHNTEDVMIVLTAPGARQLLAALTPAAAEPSPPARRRRRR